MQFNYEIISEIFENVWRGTDFSYIVYGLKGLAISFLIVRFIITIAKQELNKKSISFGGGGEVQLPITLWNVMIYVFYAVMIASYDQVLLVIDGLLGSVLNLYTDLDTTTISIQLQEDSADPVIADETWFQTLKRMGYKVIAIIQNPAIIVMSILKVIAWLFDLIIYAIFIGQRFFVLLILKLTGPLAICLSLVPGMGNTFGKWLSMYAQWFFLIIPYSLANLVIATFVDIYEDMFSTFGYGYSEEISQIGATLEIPLILFIIVLKPILYASGKQVYNKLLEFNISLDNN